MRITALLQTCLVLTLTLAPGCGEDLGADCSVDDDCADGYCCRDKNCGGGMCSLRCKGDNDCPDDMACEHDTCFYRCDRDSDCDQPGFSCEHDRTVCEAK